MPERSRSRAGPARHGCPRMRCGGRAGAPQAQEARRELSWEPCHTSVEAVEEFLDGLRAGAGMDTAPLAPDPQHAPRFERSRGRG
ncbi:hypothetical protein ACFVJM_23500 [Streptomyces virginiae]|uniref:hypothetical protein n=1 Tax=Streptomyces virginiae TaxID=1961 RepID=UPI003642CE16